MLGTTISHYRIVGTVGAGGMGVVYLAEDTRLNRKVALKFLPPAVAMDAHARARFMREAQSASALDHPNVASVYEVGDWNDQLFIAMPFYAGETLRQRIQRGPLTVDDAAHTAAQIANGLAAAHRAGIVHRDLKPANVMLTQDGQVKILDFGLAKMFSEGQATATRMTGPGTTVGTVAYMAPEQASGGDVNQRADVWALGVILHEMLTGTLPFAGDTPPAMMMAVATAPPRSLRQARPDVPETISRLADQMLEKDPARRVLTAADIARELAARQSGTVPTSAGPGQAPRGTRAVLWVGAAVLLIVAGSVAWFARDQMRTRWARETAIPEIEMLNERERYLAAFMLAREAQPVIPNDPAWTRLEPIYSRVITVHSAPSDALVSYREYGKPDAAWFVLGNTPLERVRAPAGAFEWRIEKDGYETARDVSATLPALGVPSLSATLYNSRDIPSGMVRVPATPSYQLFIPGLDHLPAVRLADFWIDRHEVTNREFKRFVDAGGYRTPAYWSHAFVLDGRRLTFAEAMARFTDTTGRPGPATWELGSFPQDRAEHPVGGVSWYEAAAFAQFAGTSLPTIYHWSRVAEQRLSGVIVPHANFGGVGPVRAGASGALHRFGAEDLAGNVKEWCWNRADSIKRYILGGGWDEPVYMFNDPDARSPFERAANFGFRCVKYAPNESLATAGAELVAFESRDFDSEKPVSDELFAAYRTLYEYDKADLAASVESTDDSHPEWRAERVSFAASYGGERVPAMMYLPRQGKPPYQAVVVFPGSGALQQRSTQQIDLRRAEWVMRSGRALIHPIYKSTYERGDAVTSDYPNRTNVWREHVIAWAKDVRRAVDYLESRSDIDGSRVAYLGISWGGAMAPISLAVEPRFKAAVLYVPGFYLQRSLPEVDAFNFAPRVKTPTLFLNGRFDFFFPEATSQLPMFNLFATPPADKRRVVYETGHNIPRPEQIRESVDWLDKYLGAVK